MRRPWIKVCGITRVEDAMVALDAGAHALGFIFAEESPRRVSLSTAREIILAIVARSQESETSTPALVGVTVNAPRQTVSHLIEETGITALQAHGEESPELCRSYGLPVVKAWRVTPSFAPTDLAAYAAFPVLLDAYHPDRRGGTGAMVDWPAATATVRAGYRVLLAGGLGPENVKAVVEAVRPLAVDFNSGVESAPGDKDSGRVRRALAQLADGTPPEESTWPW